MFSTKIFANKKNQNMNILITGHTGFLGKHVVNELSNDKTHNIYAISRSTQMQSNNIFQYQLDVLEKDKIQRIMSEKNIELVIHLCGKAIVKDCEKDSFGAFMTNSLGTASILEAARHAGVKKIISVETDKVYGNQVDKNANEDSVLFPTSPYDMSKILAANIADFYRDYYGMNIISVRPANIIGANDHNTTRIFPSIIKSIYNNLPVIIYENSENALRDFVYVKDVAKAIVLLAMSNNKHKKYNISTTSSMSIRQFAEKILAIANSTVEMKIVKKDGDFSEIIHQSIDGSRFIEEFDFKFTSIEIIVQESLKEALTIS